MSTIQDVAKMAGVSIATVSRVLQNSPKVLPQTKEKVQAAIDTLGYRPNRLAQQFRTQETGNILVLLPRLGDSFYSEILKGIETVAEVAGYHVLVANTQSRPDLEQYYFESLMQKQVDGIINFSARLPKEYMNSIAEHFPVVVACRYLSDAQLPNVTIDNMAASKEITEYMLNLGHKRIAYLCGNSELSLYRARLTGYYQALIERDFSVDEQLIIMADPDIQGGYDATMRLLHTGNSFSAIITSGDTLAVGAIKALEASQLRVPEDVAVCGFDDIELSSLINPPLTTVRQPRNLIGRCSIEKLLGRISGESNSLAEQIVLDYELVIRASSGKLISRE